MNKFINIFIVLLAITQLAYAGNTHKKSNHQSHKRLFAQYVDPTKIESPDAAIEELKKGNERFVTHRMLNQNFEEQVKHAAQGQHPYATVLSCIDSRVPVELVFDQGIGDLFVTRIAGNIDNDDIIGGLEFATKVKGSKLIVVMGHSSCGAVEGACTGAKLEHLTGLLEHIKPAVEKVSKANASLDHKSKEFVEKVADENVQKTINDLIEKSETLRTLVKEGKLKIVGAKYHLDSGKVNFF